MRIRPLFSAHIRMIMISWRIFRKVIVATASMILSIITSLWLGPGRKVNYQLKAQSNPQKNNSPEETQFNLEISNPSTTLISNPRSQILIVQPNWIQKNKPTKQKNRLKQANVDQVVIVLSLWRIGSMGMDFFWKVMRKVSNCLMF